METKDTDVKHVKTKDFRAALDKRRLIVTANLKSQVIKHGADHNGK